MKLSSTTRLLKISLGFFFVVLAAATASAQYHVTGRVKAETGESIPFANILLLSANDSSLLKGTVTDTSGYFDLSYTTAQDFLIAAQMIGYNSYYTGALIATENHSLGTIQMAEESTELDAVVVQAQKPLLEVTPNAMVVNVGSSAVMKNGNVKEVLEKSPGVVIDQDGNISVKGKNNVLIYMDGKPTYLSAADLAQLLESTSADNVEKIEIMDNPPAKYDAAGNAGIINIVRKKNASLGLNGNASLRLGYGVYPKFNPSLNLNYRAERYNLYGNYSYYFNDRYSTNEIYRDLNYTDAEGNEGTTTFDLFARDEKHIRNQSYRAGMDFYLTKRSTIGVLVNGNMGDYRSNAKGGTEISGEYDYDYDGLTSETPRHNESSNMNYNVNFEHNFENGGALNLDVDYGLWDKENAQDNNNYYYRNDGGATEDPLLVRTDMNTSIEIFAGKIDYSKTVFDGYSLEAGAKMSQVSTDNDLVYATEQEGSYVPDADRSNRFQYDETIGAGYLNISKQINEQWSYAAGMRLEYTNSEGYSVTLDSLVSRSYFNAFPSASVSFKPSDKHNMSFSFSRRIDRPNYDDLNPFEFFLDRFTFGRGNPFLNPQYTNAFTLNYGFNRMAFLTLNYNHTTDVISDIIIQEKGTQIAYQTSQNLNEQKNFSANLAVPFNATEWWMINFNATSFYNKVQSKSADLTINRGKLAGIFRIQNTISLPGEFRLEVMGSYQSPLLWDMFDVQERYWVNLGVSKSIGKFNLQASLDDLFDTNENNVLIKQGDIDAVVKNDWESRVFYFNVSYRFGNDKVKQSRRRGTALDDLSQRASD